MSAGRITSSATTSSISTGRTSGRRSPSSQAIDATNVAVDAPPIHNHNYTYENNIVWSSSGAIFQIGGKVDKQTFKRVDNNVYYNPAGRYSFRQMTLDDWRRMGLDAHTQFADPMCSWIARSTTTASSPIRRRWLWDFKRSGFEIGLKEDFPTDQLMIGEAAFAATSIVA